MVKRVIITILLACLVFGIAFSQTAKQHVTQGQAYLNEGKFAEAVASFEAALKLDKKNKDALKFLPQAQEKRTEEAYKQAQQLHSEGSYKEAIAMFDAALKYIPPGYNTRNILSRKSESQKALLQQEEDAQQALINQELLAQTQSLKERAEQSQQALQKANEFFIAGKYPDALAQYDHAVNLGGLNPAETTEAQRLMTEAKDIQTKMESLDRLLQDSDFDVEQITINSVKIKKYKASEARTINIGGVNHTVYIGIFNVVIPLKLYNSNVTMIDKDAFRNTGITSIVIPDTVTEIGVSAFAGNRIEAVTMGKSLKFIRGGAPQGRMEVVEPGAFEGNSNLASIIIPDTVTEIGARAFKDCGLTSVVLGRAVADIGESAFRNNKLPVVTFSNAIRFIRRFAFNNNQIQTLTLPNGIQIVYDDAFTKNPLTSVVIPVSLATLTRIGDLNNQPRIGGDHASFSAYTPTFPTDTLVRVTLPAGVHDDNMKTFDTSLQNVYNSPTNRKAAATYVKNGPIWTR